MSTSNTKLTNDHLRARGAVTQTVEHWNAFAKKRNDLFNVIDIVALQDARIYGIQATSWANVSARVAKALDEPKLKAWLTCGGIFQVWGWRKVKKTEGMLYPYNGHKFVAKIFHAVIQPNAQEVVFREIDKALS